MKRMVVWMKGFFLLPAGIALEGISGGKMFAVVRSEN